MEKTGWEGGRITKGGGSSQKGETEGHRGFRLVYCHSSAGQLPESRVFEERTAWDT